MRTENDPSSEDGVIEGNSQLAAAGAHSRRAFFGNAAVLGLGLAAGATTASAEPSKDGVVEAKIRRALLAGPADLTKKWDEQVSRIGETIAHEEAIETPHRGSSTQRRQA